MDVVQFHGPRDGSTSDLSCSCFAIDYRSHEVKSCHGPNREDPAAKRRERSIHHAKRKEEKDRSCKSFAQGGEKIGARMILAYLKKDTTYDAFVYNIASLPKIQSSEQQYEMRLACNFLVPLICLLSREIFLSKSNIRLYYQTSIGSINTAIKHYKNLTIELLPTFREVS